MAAMLATIKRIVVYLSVICVLLIVLEECFYRIHTGTARLQSDQQQSSRSIINTPFHINSTALDTPPPNASYDINKETADVTIDGKEEQLADNRSNKAARLRDFIHRQERIRTMNPGRAAAVTENSSNSSKTVDSTGAGLEESELEEERRLRQSPLIYLEDNTENTNSAPVVSTSVKLVSYFRPEDKDTYPAKSFRMCPYKCEYVRNMSLAHAVAFQASMIRDHVIPNFYRPAGQRWVFFTSDPAIKNYDLERSDIKSQFNWTMTYQLDSDLPTPFGHLRRQKPSRRNYDALFDRKDKLAAWFVSHCPTWGRREVYVQRMQKIMQVDIFGRCGNLSCGPIHFRQNDSTQCLPMLTQHYKFYLAFENSFCKDYLSEKFFKLFDDVDVVPVVRGGFDYKRYLPSGIFVDASDFKSPEDLSHYLLKLANDKEKYVAMLKKKSQWQETRSLPFQCTLCQALHTSPNTTHYHPNLRIKFNGKTSDCFQPTDLVSTPGNL